MERITLAGTRPVGVNGVVSHALDAGAPTSEDDRSR
jgi:hypothetical protein